MYQIREELLCEYVQGANIFSVYSYCVFYNIFCVYCEFTLLHTDLPFRVYNKGSGYIGYIK